MSTANVLVTGATTGIGEATALHLDELGFRVFAGVRQPMAGASLRSRSSERLTPVLLDVTDPAGIEAAAKTVATEVGDAGLTGLVNNAGVSVTGPLEFVDLDELRNQLEVNVVGQIAVLQAFMPAIRQGRGRVVNVGSMGGYNAAPFVGPYSASKFALEALTDSLRRELRAWGIEVSIIEPGSIETAIWGKGWSYADDHKAKASERELELYGDAFDTMTDYMKNVSERAIPARKVAEAVHHALTASRPKTRYRVGVDARVARWITRLLPDRAQDALLARMIGLPKRP